VVTPASYASFAGERFRQIAEEAPVGLWRINATFDQDWVNRHWLDYTGGRLEDEVGFGWVEKVHPEDRERVIEEFDRAFEAREPTQVEFRLLGKDGQYRWFRDNGTPCYRDGEFDGFMGSCFDITEKRQAETRLKSLQAQLVERSGIEASSILAALSVHEVSQPLQAIEAHVARLEKISPGTNERSAELAEIVTSMRQAADHARGIVRSCKEIVFDVPAERKEQDLGEVLRLIEPLIRRDPAVTHLTLKWALAADLRARISTTQFQQLVLHLCANGLEAMQSEPHQELAISAARWGQAAVVSVADLGSGIAETLKEKIFERFVSGKPDRMGLGLYLSRLIATAHGGRIWAEDNPGGGSIFRFTIPLESPEDA
jgi:PAS domain S-box-containing protein